LEVSKRISSLTNSTTSSTGLVTITLNTPPDGAAGLGTGGAIR
jgi:hypothetical protein